MNSLFDRYLLVLAGRLTAERWDRTDPPRRPEGGVITLDWPPDDSAPPPGPQGSTEPAANRSLS